MLDKGDFFSYQFPAGTFQPHYIAHIQAVDRLSEPGGAPGEDFVMHRFPNYI